MNMNAIIDIPEIFEEVLFRLPFLDLVIATGVNRTFRNFISNSQKLQRKLFQLPSITPRSEEEQKHINKHGILGRTLSHDNCLSLATGDKPLTVTLCPFLLEPSCLPNTPTAHLTARAAEAYFWPGMYLTDPPCAHAYVYFTYVGIDKDHVNLLLEGGRSIYRRHGVTFAAIEEALSQPGSVSFTKCKLKKMKRCKIQNHTTMANAVKKCQGQHGCELYMDLSATTITLHGVPVRADGVWNSTITMRGVQGLLAWGAQKIRFED